MIGLAKIELLKLFRQQRTLYGISVIFAIELFIVAGAYVQGRDVLELLLENLSKTFVLEGNLMNGHLVMYLVLNSLWFNFPLIMMILVSGMLTNEHKDGTIQTIFLQAVSKRLFIIGKFMAAIIFSVMVSLFVLVTSMLMAYIVFGNGDLITYLEGLNFFAPEVAFQRILLGFGSGILLMTFYGVTSISLAVWFKDQTITWILCAFVLIFNGLLLKVDFGFLNQWLLPKMTNAWQQFFYYELNWSVIAHQHLLLLLYTVLIALIGGFSFIKKEIG